MTSWFRLTWSRLRSLITKNQLEREFDEELTTHLELLTDEFRRRGLSAADARREALLKLGRPDRLREVHREQRGLPLFDILAQDVRYAVRMLLKSPAFTFVVTVSLALGIGANTALFSLVDGLLLRSLPVRAPDRLVQIQVVPVMPGGFRKPFPVFEPSVFDAVRAHSQVVSEVVGFWRLDRPTIAVDGAAEPAREVDQISTNFFRDLGVTPVIGRAPAPSDDAVAVISDRWWRARFGGSPGVLGRTLSVDGQTFSIIGVAPPRFHGFMVESSADVWISSPAANRALMMIARLQPDVTAVQAQAALHGIVGPFVENVFSSRHGDGNRARPRRPGALTVARPVQGRAAGAHGSGHARAAHHLHECRQPADGEKCRPESRADRARRARRRPIAPDSPIPRRKRAARRLRLRLGSGPGAMGCFDRRVDAAVAGDPGKPDVSR